MIEVDSTDQIYMSVTIEFKTLNPFGRSMYVSISSLHISYGGGGVLPFMALTRLVTEPSF